MLHQVIRPKIPETVFAPCLPGDRLLAENILMVSQEIIPTLNVTCSVVTKNGMTYKILVPSSSNRDVIHGQNPGHEQCPEQHNRAVLNIGAIIEHRGQILLGLRLLQELQNELPLLTSLALVQSRLTGLDESFLKVSYPEKFSFVRHGIQKKCHEHPAPDVEG